MCVCTCMLFMYTVFLCTLVLWGAFCLAYERISLHNQYRSGMHQVRDDETHVHSHVLYSTLARCNVPTCAMSLSLRPGVYSRLGIYCGSTGHTHGVYMRLAFIWGRIIIMHVGKAMLSHARVCMCKYYIHMHMWINNRPVPDTQRLL